MVSHINFRMVLKYLRILGLCESTGMFAFGLHAVLLLDMLESLGMFLE